MRITYKAVYDIETWELLEWEGDPCYCGPIELVKGSHSSAEQSNADQQRAMENNLTQQQLAMQQQQFQMQQKQLDSVNATVDPIIAAGGLAPGVQSALTAQLMNTIPQQFQNVAGNINNSLVARGITGGGMAGSGDIARDFGALGAAQAGMQQQGLTDIQLQKQQGLMQALGLKMGVGGMYGQNMGLFGQGAGSFNAGAGTALNAGVQAGYNADQASTSLMGPLLGGLMGMGSTFATGGAKKLFG